jgi:hypothetical protein
MDSNKNLKCPECKSIKITDWEWETDGQHSHYLAGETAMCKDCGLTFNPNYSKEQHFEEKLKKHEEEEIEKMDKESVEDEKRANKLFHNYKNQNPGSYFESKEFDEWVEKEKEEMKELSKEENQIIYLAGKVGGKKWDIDKKINNNPEDLKANFISSDGRNHSEHDWGYGYYEFDSDSMREQLKSGCLDEIEKCDFLIAWLDTPDSYGSIAEIAYASSIGKKCFVFIKPEIIKENELDSPMHDAYWFVSHFPNVETLVLPFEETVELIKIICERTRSKVSKQCVHGFSSKIALEGLKKEEEKNLKDLEIDLEELIDEDSNYKKTKIIDSFKRNFSLVKELKEKHSSCQICDFTFKKKNGENYNEVHHIVPLSNKGKDAEINTLVLCANCHRQLHYAKIDISKILDNKIIINGEEKLIKDKQNNKPSLMSKEEKV